MVFPFACFGELQFGDKRYRIGKLMFFGALAHATRVFGRCTNERKRADWHRTNTSVWQNNAWDVFSPPRYPMRAVRSVCAVCFRVHRVTFAGGERERNL